MKQSISSSCHHASQQFLWSQNDGTWWGGHYEGEADANVHIMQESYLNTTTMKNGLDAKNV